MTNKELSIILRLRDEASKQREGFRGNLQRFANAWRRNWLTIMVELDTMPVDIKGRKDENIPYADKTFMESGISLDDLRTAYWGLIRAEEKKKPEQANIVIPEFQSLKSPGNPDAYIFVRSGGIQVGFAGSSMTRWTVADEIRDILKRFPAR